MEKKVRQVKLARKYLSVQGGQSFNGVRASAKIVPWLNVSGAWLAAAGFSAGGRVEIVVENNLLIIKNLDTDGAICD